MRISRFFTDQPLAAGHLVTLGGSTSHYILRVLKLRSGAPLVLFNGDGADYAAEITELDRQQVSAQVNTRLPAAAESPLAIHLVQGISRGERMDLTLQKATELGVAGLLPVFTERVEVRLRGERLDKRLRHWVSVVRSACEQCGRARIPVVSEPLDLSDWLARPSGRLRLVLDPEAEKNLSALTLRGQEVELLAGPEGGLSEPELKQARIAGYIPVKLGPRVLRTETAGPAAIAVLQALAGDF